MQSFETGGSVTRLATALADRLPVPGAEFKLRERMAPLPSAAKRAYRTKGL